MDNQTINAVARELAREITDGTFGKVFQLRRTSLVIEFRVKNDLHKQLNRLLLVAAEPSQPRLHFITTPLREVEKTSLPLASFALTLRKHLAHATLAEIKKDDQERIVRFHFIAHAETGERFTRTLIVQLTGRSSNLFLLDEGQRIIDALRFSSNDANQIGYEHIAPTRPPASQSTNQTSNENRNETSTASRAISLSTSLENFAASPSAALERHFTAIERSHRFQTRAAALLSLVRKDIAKRQALRRNLERDLALHGDAAEHKRVGDLLLANLANATRDGERVRLVDYYDDDAPLIEIEVDENKSLQEEAAHRFARYAKAKRAHEHTTARLIIVSEELHALEQRQRKIDDIIIRQDEAALDALTTDSIAPRRRQNNAQQVNRGREKPSRSSQAKTPNARVFRSSDGYEILVGRGARGNDELTFKLARPHDLWLHAADYRGAHVVIRNSKRTEIPQRTVIEAAQLAAFNSDAKNDSRVSVNYAERKFISKPKGSAPGLVRLSSFKTLLVEPRESGERVL